MDGQRDRETDQALLQPAIVINGHQKDHPGKLLPMLPSSGELTHQKNWTETAVFVLSKYSRSYSPKPSDPPIPPLSDTQTSTQPLTSPHQQLGSLRWSHYNQPKLSLIVETVHSDSQSINPHGVPILYRNQRIIIKVIWNNNPQSNDGQSFLNISDPADAPGVFILEKVNLSDVQDSFGHSRVEEASVKATSKDCMVGISYATGYSAGSLVFNRIQLKFQTREDCLKFITILQAITPCKMKSSSTGAVNRVENSQKAGSTKGNPSGPLIESIDSQTQFGQSEHLQEWRASGTPTSINVRSPEMIQSFNGLSHLGTEKNKRKSPPSSLPSENLPNHLGSSSTNLPPIHSSEDIDSLINSSEQTLRECIYTIVSEPGFDNLVKRIKRIISEESE